LSALRLLVASLGVMLAVVASLGPIVVFFALSTSHYPFMVILNVATCTVAGILGLSFLLRTLHRLVIIQKGLETELVELKAEQAENAPLDIPSNQVQSGKAPLTALDRVGKTHRKAKSVFQIWIIVFALVGAQMSWVLRPFIGSPNMHFTWFRAQQGNFFIAIFKALGAFFS
jgi:hypothetical protein